MRNHIHLSAKLLDVFLATILSAASSAPCLNAGEPTVDDILKVWKTRANSTRSIRAEWHVKLTVAEGAYVAPKGAAATDGAAVRYPSAPAQTANYDLPFRLLAAGERVKAELSDVILNPNSGMGIRKWMWAFDGKERRALSQPHVNPFPGGSRSKTLSDLDTNSMYLIPLLAVLRPLSPVAGPIRELANNMTLVRGETTVSGRLVHYLRQDSKSSLSGSLWVDTERDFVPVRFIQSYKGKSLCQVDFLDYRQTDFGWIPWRWTAIVLGRDGRINKSSEARVRVLEVNKVIDDSEFEINFPVGTWVTDEFEEKEYLVLEDEKKRTITADDLVNRSYESMMNDAHSGIRPWRFLIACVVGVSCVLAGIYLWRKGKFRPA